MSESNFVFNANSLVRESRADFADTIQTSLQIRENSWFGLTLKFYTYLLKLL